MFRNKMECATTGIATLRDKLALNGSCCPAKESFDRSRDPVAWDFGQHIKPKPQALNPAIKTHIDTGEIAR
jgi:hypothetical protein